MVTRPYALLPPVFSFPGLQLQSTLHYTRAPSSLASRLLFLRRRCVHIHLQEGSIQPRSPSKSEQGNFSARLRANSARISGVNTPRLRSPLRGYVSRRDDLLSLMVSLIKNEGPHPCRCFELNALTQKPARRLRADLAWDRLIRGTLGSVLVKFGGRMEESGQNGTPIRFLLYNFLNAE